MNGISESYMTTSYSNSVSNYSNNERCGSNEYIEKTEQDTLQLSVRELDKAQICETYENLRIPLREMPAGCQNKLFDETYDIMRDYYNGKIDKEEVKEKIHHYLEEMVGMPQNCNTPFMKQRAGKVMASLYEHFSRANSRNAVAKNQQEEIDYMKKSGVKDAELDAYSTLKGSIYYNAEYYYACKDMQEFFKAVLDESAQDYGVSKVDYDYVEQNTRFTLDGGLSYNGVWNHNQYQGNHYWMDGAQGEKCIIDNDFVPPRGLIYCFTDCIHDENVERVEQFIREEKLNETDNDNKLRGKIKSMLLGLRYGDSLLNDLDRIKQTLEKSEIHFFTRQSVGYGFNYFQMLTLEENMLC